MVLTGPNIPRQVHLHHLSKNGRELVQCPGCLDKLVRGNQPLLKLINTKVEWLSGSLLRLYAARLL